MYAEKHLKHPHSKIISLQFINNKKCCFEACKWSRKSYLDQTQQRPQLCTGSRNPGVVSLPQLPPEYHCNRDRKGCIIASNSELSKLIYRCIAMIFFTNATDVQQYRKYQPHQKIKN